MEKETIRDEKGRFTNGTCGNLQKGNIPWNKGLTKETDERMKNISESKKGKERPEMEEWHKQNKNSENPKGMLGKTAWNKGLTKEIDGRIKQYGEKISANVNRGKNISKSKIGHSVNLETIEKIRKTKKDYIKEHPEQIEILKRQRANQIFPKKDTKIELKIQNYLKLLHIEFMTHYYISEITYAYQCDILIPSKKIVIEADGCYWHGCPVCNKKLSEKQLEQIKKDEIRTKELQEKGYEVIRLREHDIKKMNSNTLQEKLNIQLN